MNLIPEVKAKVERPFPEKLAETSAIIQKRLSMLDKKVAVAWSGGKDSTLVLYFVRLVYPDVPVVFNNTGVEYPETVKFVHEIAERWKINLTETNPIKSFWQCVKEYGMPVPKRSKGKNGKYSSKLCCRFLKILPMENAIYELDIEGYFTGVTAVENRTRMFVARDKGTCYKTIKEGIWKIHPILWWTEDEVRSFITENKIPLNPIYLKGADRCGCMPCTAFTSWESQLSQTNPNMYAYIKKLKDKQFVMTGVLK